LQAHPPSPKRALLLFTRSPANEARRKPLAGELSFAERVGLYESFTRHVLAQTSALGYPILVATDEPEHNFARYSNNVAAVFQQRSSSFGAKLGDALQSAFAQGYDEVVCVGNDCLELSTDDLHRAFEQLATRSLVFGAARDGGVYLIGVRRESLPQVLRAVRECHWQTAVVLADLVASARRYAIATAVLREHGDIDSTAELLRANTRSNAPLFLRRYAARLLPQLAFSFAAPFLPPNTFCRDPLRFQKAPPAFLQ
jgi:glycosyltransferase A (GT-A) superfamily protein (DUF2064 family)